MLFQKTKLIFLIYEKLIGYKYLFITDFYHDFEAEFIKNNFIHLTGLNISIESSRFFDNLKNGTASYSMIAKRQTHDIKTINKKFRVLRELELFLENKFEESNLIIDDFRSLTSDKNMFSYSLRNEKKRFTLVFSKNNCARSVRYELSAQGQDRQKVIFILRKKKNDRSYNTLIYRDENYEIIDIPRLTLGKYMFDTSGNLYKTRD